MNGHIDSVVRISLLLGFALLAMPLLRGRSAVARRLVLSVALVAAFVVPFVPSWHVAGPHYQALAGRFVAENVVAATSPVTLPARTATRSIDLIAILWALGALLVTARFVIGIVLAQRLVTRGAPAPAWESAIARAERQTGRRAVVFSSEIDAPAVSGMLWPTILVPASSASWSEERKLAVLLHELAHVAAFDLAVQLLAGIVCSIHWYNPLLWLVARRLRLERELAADEAVLRSGVRASTYAADLLAIAGGAPFGTLAIAEQPLPKRIAAIVAERRPALLGWRGASVTVFGSAAVALGVACAGGAPSSSAPLTAARTSDRELQSVAERELVAALHEWKAERGTILVLSPKGEVLADAGGRSDALYVTGSTLKTLLLAAAIDANLVRESDVIDCSPGSRVHDASPHGPLALPDVLATSSNVGFAQIFDRVGGARLDGTLHRFQFATPPGLAAARAGDEMGTLTAIGETMSATPRQMALAYAALADGGDGIVRADTATRVGALLENVVTSEHGTGQAARVSGVRVAGKTGTSEWTDPDGKVRTYASFIGYAPADHPRYVVFVGVESPIGEEASGGTVAAPVFARVASRALSR